MMTASEVHTQLKEKAKQRSLDITEVISQKHPGDEVKILMPEFKNMLNKLGFTLEMESLKSLEKVGKESLSILQNFDMHLKKEHFNLFLARCGLENSQTGINYVDLLWNFQDRCDRGTTHKILSNPKHKLKHNVASAIIPVYSLSTNSMLGAVKHSLWPTDIIS